MSANDPTRSPPAVGPPDAERVVPRRPRAGSRRSRAAVLAGVARAVGLGSDHARPRPPDRKRLNGRFLGAHTPRRSEVDVLRRRAAIVSPQGERVSSIEARECSPSSISARSADGGAALRVRTPRRDPNPHDRPPPVLIADVGGWSGRRRHARQGTRPRDRWDPWRPSGPAGLRRPRRPSDRRPASTARSPTATLVARRRRSASRPPSVSTEECGGGPGAGGSRARAALKGRAVAPSRRP